GSVEGVLAALEGGGPAAEAEARALARSLFVRVSGFFRDPEMFQALEDAAYPELLASHRRGGEPIRVWSVACSRGQEAYSLALSLGRWARQRGVVWPVEVLGTDLDTESLRFARAGVYDRRAVEGVAPDLLQEAFEPGPGGAWTVGAGLRAAVRFQRADALDFASHPAGFDLVSCRNLLIYFKREAQEELILALGRALRPGGFLVLGTSETVLGRPWRQFDHVHPAQRIYRRPGGS
ncbi:MAG: CheR family methyltransferase, partial [Deferrisomatales bacterium]